MSNTHSHDPLEHVGPPATEHRCDDAIAQLQAFLDGELDEVTVARIEAHLQECSPCLEAYDFEAELRKVIVAKLREDVPGDLRGRIMSILDRLESEDADSADAPS